MNYRLRVAYYRVIDTITYSRIATWLSSLTFRGPLSSPYFTPQAMLARHCANAATILWAIIVLSKTDALVSANASYGWITAYVPENWVAGALLALAMVQTVWLALALRPPRYCGACGYGLIAFFWGFIAFSIYFNARTLFPTSGAIAPIIFGLALYGFISIPAKRIHALA